MPSKIKLIIGIGNPEEQYHNTRHNVGFMMLDYIATREHRERSGGRMTAKKGEANDFELDKKSNSEIVKCKLGKTSVILAKPHTYVNKSGEAAKKLLGNLKFKIENLIVVQDDLDIPFGNTKISFEKNSGGHRGIESVMKTLKTKKFYRLRIGLATTGLKKARQQTDKRRDEFIMKFVLSKFSPSEQEQLKKIFKNGYEKLLQIQ